MSKMRKAEAETFNKIQHLLTKKANHKTPEKNVQNNKKSEAKQFVFKSDQKTPPKRNEPKQNKTQQKKSPSRRSPHVVLSKPPEIPVRNFNVHVERNLTPTKIQQMENKNEQVEEKSTFKVQNRHSHFLNAKNPKPPIYQRTKEIVKKRQMWLQQKNQEKLLQKQAEVDEQQAQLSLAPSRPMSKEQAYELSQKLYRQHYNKALRHNQQYLKRAKIDSQHYRNKPNINDTSKEIFKLFTEKNQFQNDVFQRFTQYNEEKKKKKEMQETMYKKKYYPFQPKISDNSRIIANAKGSSKQLSRSKHCVSCHDIKRKKSYQNMTQSSKNNFSPVKMNESNGNHQKSQNFY